MSTVPTNAENIRQRNRRTLRWGLLASLAAFGFGFALVPFYDLMCEKIFGIRPEQQAVSAPICTKIDASRTITVEFDTSIQADLPWSLDSQKTTVNVHPCELTEVVFIATNYGAMGMSGQAIFGVAPTRVSNNLAKTECFCFTEQYLAAGESRKMPVRFMLDDQFPPDVNTVTFRYVFNPLRPGTTNSNSDSLASFTSAATYNASTPSL